VVRPQQGQSFFQKKYACAPSRKRATNQAIAKNGKMSGRDEFEVWPMMGYKQRYFFSLLQPQSFETCPQISLEQGIVKLDLFTKPQRSMSTPVTIKIKNGTIQIAGSR